MTDRMDAETRARVTSEGGRARAAALTAQERADIARQGAARTNSPAGRARAIVKAWPGLSRAERAEVRAILRSVLQ